MALVNLKDSFVAVASGSEIQILSDKNGIKNRLLLPDVKKTEDDERKANKLPIDSSGRVLCTAFSRCVQYFAACNDRKQLAIWETEKWTLVNCRLLNRRASQVCFTVDSSRIIVADRSGEVYSFNVNEVSLEVEPPILGHISLLLDMVLSVDNRFIITCDRDEKIRVSRFPNAYNIESFCLGHSEFVISLSLMSLHPEILVSASGDGTLRLWDFQRGRELHRIDCLDYLKTLPSNNTESSDQMDVDEQTVICDSAASNSIHSDRLNNHQRLVSGRTLKKCCCMPQRNIIATLYFGSPEISFFSINFAENGTTIASSSHITNVTLLAEAWDACFDDNGRLWVLQPDEIQPVVLVKTITRTAMEENCTAIPITFEIESCAENSVVQILNTDWKFFKHSLNVQTEVRIMFKQWFDNVRDYLVRKEQRIEERKVKKSKTQKWKNKTEVQ